MALEFPALEAKSGRGCNEYKLSEERFQVAFVGGNRVSETLRAAGGGGSTSRDSIEEFVAFFYEFVRDDAALVRVLDRVLRARHGTFRNTRLMRVVCSRNVGLGAGRQADAGVVITGAAGF